MLCKILITSPSLDTKANVSGISSITNFIISGNPNYQYTHFSLGKKDNEKRGAVYLLKVFKAFLSWLKLLVAERNTIIHFNFALETRAIIRDTPFILTARLFRKRMIIHLHGGKYLMNNPPRWINLIMRIVLAGGEPKIVLSILEKQIIVDRYAISKVYILPNCIDLTESLSFNRTFFTEQRPLNLLFIGRIVESKGIEYIYRACVLLKQHKIKFNFILAGKGPEEQIYIPKFAALLEGNFVFKGIVAGSEKISLVKQCDVFLLPSIYGEGLPMALLECMSYGLVPIVTSDGSMSSLVKNNVNGFIVKRHSEKDIANAVCRLSTDRCLLKSMSGMARGTILKDYDLRQYVIKLNEVYKHA